MTLFDDITKLLEDDDNVAIRMQGELEPVQGAGAAICPPTYAGSGKGPSFAASDGAFVPVRDEQTGWFDEVARTEDGPRRSKRVVINSIAACNGAMETALFRARERFDLALPGFTVAGEALSAEARAELDRAVTKALKSASESTQAAIRREVQQALGVRASTWDLGHRMADAWLMYAEGTDGQVWTEGDPIKGVLLRIALEHGDTVYAYAPNCALFGNWLSHGTARRNAIPRSITCEITGYGVSEVHRGATKLDPMGGATSTGRKLKQTDSGIEIAAAGKKPSEFGFGQIPTAEAVRAFSCETILRQAAISLTGLAKFRFENDRARARSRGARRVFVLLGMLGYLLAARETFLRSGCDLVTVDERWGIRRHGVRTPVDFPVPTIDETAQALRQAIDVAAELGLVFAEHTVLAPSVAQLELILDRVVHELKSVQSESDA